MVYLDNAATSFPKPREVVRAVNEALTVYGGNPGRGGCPPSSLAAEKVFETREEVDRFFDGHGEPFVVFTANATDALNKAILGTVLKTRKKHLVLTAFEHNSVYRSAEAVREAGGSFTVVPPDLGSDRQTVRRILSAIRRDTAAVCMTHASNVCGRVLPVEEVGRALVGSGVALIVDASQSAGHRRISMKESHISILCTAGHKGLLAPAGTGLMLLSPAFLPSVTVFGGTGSNSSQAVMPSSPPERYEAGTLNVPGILGLCAGLSVLSSEAGREAALAGRLYRGLRDIPSVHLLLPYSPDTCVPTVSFLKGDRSSFELADALCERGYATRGGLHCAPLCHRFFGTSETGTVRVSVGRYNTAEEIDGFLNAVEKI